MPQTSSTHQLVDVKEVKENIAVLKNGNLRMVLMVSSINFALKSQDEQQAVIARFQDFVNSLNYTVQIVVRSRKLDITEYLNFLNERVGIQSNELLKIQTGEYITFIQELIKLSNIMSKFFYVVIPVNSPITLEAGQSIFSFFSKKKNAAGPSPADLSFESKKNELSQRAEQIAGLLGTMGLKTIPLGREELIELLYTNYNPGAILKQKNLEQLIATGDEAKKPN